MKHITDTLIRAIEAAGNPTVLGLDTQYAHVPPQIAERFGDSPEGKVAAIGAYNRSLVDLSLIHVCDVAVIDKPKGLVVHPAPGNRQGTLVNGLLYRLDGCLLYTSRENSGAFL